MKEYFGNPFCLTCGARLIQSASKYLAGKKYYFFYCETCKDNSFWRSSPLLCPHCNSDIMVFRDQGRATRLCSNITCSSWQHDTYVKFKRIWNDNYTNDFLNWRVLSGKLEWEINCNYFLFRNGSGMVHSFDRSYFLAKFMNSVIDAQGWDWKSRPRYTNSTKSAILGCVQENKEEYK